MSSTHIITSDFVFQHSSRQQEFAVICFLCPDRHRQSADNDQNQPGKRLSAQLFFEYEIGKSDGNDNAELIDRYDNADDAVLYGVIVTEP